GDVTAAAHVREAPAQLAWCRVCGWQAAGADACASCGEELSVHAPAAGTLVAATSLNGVSFLAVAVAPDLTVLALGAAAPPESGARVELAPRPDGTLEPRPAP